MRLFRKDLIVLAPYIGITDFVNFQQVQEMLAVFKTNLPKGSPRKLHVGVMMSYKTLHGFESKWTNAFAPKERIADIFSYGETYNCLHYADYDEHPWLSRHLARALSFGGQNIQALQLDMIWPDPVRIAAGVQESKKNVEVILQVGSKALDVVQNDPHLLTEKLRDYEGVIHRVLLDKSGGRGKGMDAVALLPFARAIREEFPALGLVAAGGLGPDTLDLVSPLVREFPELSIDAQGKLRPSGSALDPIDWHIAGLYLARALARLG